MNQPPSVPVITLSPVSPGPTQAVSFSASSSDPEGGAVAYQWDLGNGSNATGSTATQSYANPGSYTVTVIATDAQGATSRSTQAVSVVNQLPSLPVMTVTGSVFPVGSRVALTAASTDPEGQVLTYSWQLGNSTTATGSSVSQVYTAPGSVTVTVTVTDPHGGSRQSSTTLTITNSAPSVPGIVVSSQTAAPQLPVSFSATSTDPEGLPLSFAWDFGDGATGSGATASHAYAAEGVFTARVTVTDSAGATSTNTVTLTIATPAPTGVTATPTATQLYPKQIIEWTGRATDPTGLPLSYSWNFGDGNTATGAAATHFYATAGTYNAVLTARNSANRATTVTVPIQVLTPTQPAPLDNTWQVYCSGPLCGAVDANTYAGPGVGVWRFHNAQVSPASVNVRIGGMSPGLSASLVFSNGNIEDSTSLPSAGSATSLAVQSQKTAPKLASPRDVLSARFERAERAHRWKVEDNLRFSREQTTKLPAGELQKSRANETPVVRKLPPPAVGSTRVWRANFGINGTPYTSAVVATCQLPTGRHAVFWLDQSLLALPVAAANVEAMRSTFCGPGSNPWLGSYGRLVQMVGDVYGTNVSSNPAVIQEAPGALQDFNIVVFDVPLATSWGAFASAGDVYLRTPSEQYRNEALMVGFNGFYFREAGFSTFVISSLVHETMHMINHYQRELSRQKYFAAFLEETTAMMAEDLIPPVVAASLGIDLYRTESRFSSVFFLADPLSYTNWNSPLSGSLYGLGATLGTSLHRRFGATVLPQLVQCNDGPLTSGSWSCLDQVIRSNGGNGVLDEFSLMGASLFGLVPDRKLPWGMGFASTQVNEFRLPKLWPGSYKGVSPLRIMPTGSFLATSHAFDRVVIPTGQSQFVRDNVVIPPNATLLVVVTPLADF